MAAFITRADVEGVIGSSNVEAWCDLNNNRNPDEIDAQVTLMINLACETARSRFRNSTYKLADLESWPLFKRYTAQICADEMYGPRKVVEAEASKDMMKTIREQAQQFVDDVFSRKLDPGTDKKCRPYPAVVRDETVTPSTSSITAVWVDNQD